MYSVNIFVDSDAPVEVFTRQVEQAFGIKLKANTNEKRGFMYADYQQWLVIHEQDNFVNRDESVADFSYWIEVGSYAARYSERLKLAYEFAQLIYEKLKATRQYHFLMLADPQAALYQVEPFHQRAS